MIVEAIETKVGLEDNLFTFGRVNYYSAIVRFVGAFAENTRFRFGRVCMHGDAWRFDVAEYPPGPFSILVFISKLEVEGSMWSD
jgi:hypothetical protein